jgi:hypothetical protein
MSLSLLLNIYFPHFLFLPHGKHFHSSIPSLRINWYPARHRPVNSRGCGSRCCSFWQKCSRMWRSMTWPLRPASEAGMGRKGMVAGYPMVLEHETGTLSLNASWYLDSFTGDFPSELWLWLPLAMRPWDDCGGIGVVPKWEVPVYNQ